MSTSPGSNRCTRCGGSTAPATSGRITQWVVACTCKLTDLSPQESGTEVTASVVICQNCGKRMEQGRVGSFTQWVFRSDICACDNPQPMSQVIQVTSGPWKRPAFWAGWVVVSNGKCAKLGRHAHC